MTAPEPPKKTKRAWMPFWRLPVIPLCPVHKVPMTAASTRTQPDGLIIQHRHCPCEDCEETAMTTYRR